MTESKIKKVLWLKFLESGGVPPIASTQGSKYHWSLPRSGKKSKWTRPVNDLELCKRGYHLTDLKHAIFWSQPELYVAEVEINEKWEELKESFRNYTIDDQRYKVAFRKVRLIRRVRRWNATTVRRMILKLAIHAIHLTPRSKVSSHVRKKLLGMLRLCLRDPTQANLRSFQNYHIGITLPSELEEVLTNVNYGGKIEFQSLRDAATAFRDGFSARDTRPYGDLKSLNWMMGLFKREIGLNGRSL